MNELEAKFRCLELAVNLHRQSGQMGVEEIVKTSTTLYNHINSPIDVPKSTTLKVPKKDNPPPFVR